MEALDKESFATEVHGSSGLVVVDWWGPRCAPCLALMPQVEALAEQLSGKVQFFKINAAENRRLAIQEQTMALPTISFYRDGEKVDQIAGPEVRIDLIQAKIAELETARMSGR